MNLENILNPRSFKTYLAKSMKTKASRRDTGMSLLILFAGGFIRSTISTPFSSLKTFIRIALLFIILKNSVLAAPLQL